MTQVDLSTPRERSPYGLIQEEYRNDAFKLLVCCMCLNLTNIKQVRSVIYALFKRYPDAQTMAKADKAELIEMIRSLGFYNRRADGLIKMARAFISDWHNVEELPGVGKYASDSYRIFVEGKLDVVPTDRKLINYKEWALSHGKSTQG